MCNLSEHEGQGFSGSRAVFVHECRECSASALLSFHWCTGLIMFRTLCYIKWSTSFSGCILCPSGTEQWQHPSVALSAKIASARETLWSPRQDVNTVIAAWTEGRGHFSSNWEERHCAERDLVMERDDIEAGRKRVVWQVMCSEVTLARSPQA